MKEAPDLICYNKYFTTERVWITPKTPTGRHTVNFLKVADIDALIQYPATGVTKIRCGNWSVTIQGDHDLYYDYLHYLSPLAKRGSLLTVTVVKPDDNPA